MVKAAGRRDGGASSSAALPTAVLATPLPQHAASMPTMTPAQKRFMEMRMQQALGRSGIEKPQSLPVQVLMGQAEVLQQAASNVAALVASVGRRPTTSDDSELHHAAAALMIERGADLAGSMGKEKEEEEEQELLHGQAAARIRPNSASRETAMGMESLMRGHVAVGQSRTRYRTGSRSPVVDLVAVRQSATNYRTGGRDPVVDPLAVRAAAVAAARDAAAKVAAKASAAAGPSSDDLDTSESVYYTATGEGLDRVTAREPARFNINAYDADGNEMLIGDVPIFVQVRGVSRVRARVVAGGKNDTFMTIEWKPTCSGQYHIVVSRLGVPFPGSPFNPIANDPEPSAAQCVVRGEALTHAVSREMNKFELEFKDKLGFVTHAVDLDVFVEPVPPNSPRAAPFGRPMVSASQMRQERDSPAPSMRDRPQPPKGASGGQEQHDSGYDSDAIIGTSDVYAAAPARRRSAGAESVHAATPACETRHRRIRVKVADKPLIVRAGFDLDSEQIGQLLPGAIATVIEERITPGNVRAMVSLDLLGKEDADGIKRTGLTFRSDNITFRSDGASIPSPPLTKKTISRNREVETSDQVGESGGTSHRRKVVRADGAYVGPSSHRYGGSSHRNGSSSHRKVLKASRRVEAVNEGGASHGNAGYRGGNSNSNRSRSEESASGQPPASIERPPPVMVGPNVRDNPLDTSKQSPPIKAIGLTPIGEEAEEDEVEEKGSLPAQQKTSGQPKLGAAHDRVKKLWGLKSILPSKMTDLDVRSPLPTPITTPVQRSPPNGSSTPLTPVSPLLSKSPSLTPPRSAPKAFHERLNWGLRQSHENDELSGGPAEAPDALAGKVGWITLVKDGKKLVTSRLRLDAIAKNEQVDQWKRRVQNNKVTQTPKALNDAKKLAILRESEKTTLAGDAPTLPIAFELADDPASFAYGGVFPGTLHSHGQLHTVHRVSYSIGVAGQYLLHVRLRKQAVALPGSPFMLKVEAGRAHALSSRLPPEPLISEVGTKCVVIVSTADCMGNPRHIGGDLDNFILESNSNLCKCVIEDLGDGSYKLSWTSDVPGKYKVHVKINQEDIVNSPTQITFQSTIPVLENSEIIFPDHEIPHVAKQPSRIQIRLVDQFENAALPTDVYKKEKWDVNISLINSDDLRNLSEGEGLPPFPYTGTWLPGGDTFEMSFTPIMAGEHELHVYYTPTEEDMMEAMLEGEKNAAKKDKDKGASDKASDKGASGPGKKASQATMKTGLSRLAAEKRSRNNGNRLPFRGSPFMIQVDRDSNEVTEQRGGTATGDYAIERTVFEEAQRRWKTFTVDAFSSEASAMVSSYWTKAATPGAVGNDSLQNWRDVWSADQIVWAHPPVELLPTLATVLAKPDRRAETVVCCPLWSSAKWFRAIESVSDESARYGAGKLHKVAADAPARCEEWPIMLFHVPAQDPPRRQKEAKDSTSGSQSTSPASSPTPGSPTSEVPMLKLGRLKSNSKSRPAVKSAWPAR